MSRISAWQALVIVLAGATVGQISNSMISRPYLAPLRPMPLAARSGAVMLVEAHVLHKQGRATFLDASPPRESARRHIAGALPAYPFRDLRGLAHLHRERPLVLYCASPRCGVVRVLAGRLREMGFKNVRLLGAGMRDWLRAGYPIGGR